MAEGERQPPPDSSEETPSATPTFIIPKKEIHTVPDMGKWKRSQAYADYIGFILTLNEGVKGKKLTFDYKVSEAIEKLVALLDTLDRWIDETPPVDQPSRFGNKAYRTWYAKLDQEAENLVATVIPTNLAAAVPEVAVYLKEAVGNSTRIDYGTGILRLCGSCRRHTGWSLRAARACGVWMTSSSCPSSGAAPSS